MKPEDLETHIADNDVMYVLVHSSPENPILVSIYFLYRAPCLTF